MAARASFRRGWAGAAGSSSTVTFVAASSARCVFVDVEAPAVDVELRELFAQRVRRYAGVDDGAQEHVAADAGEAVEVGYASQSSLLWECA